MNVTGYNLPRSKRVQLEIPAFTMTFAKQLNPLCSVVLLFITVLCATNVAVGQSSDFDRDSIYYTPLSRTAPTSVKRNVSVFRDTTTTGQFTRYFFDVGIAMLAGCRDCGSGTEFTFSTSTVHGVTLGKKIRAGAGAGFDTYSGWMALPMFGSVGYDLIGTRNTHALFIQGQYGWSYVWSHSYSSDFAPEEQHGGPMFAALMGYRVRYHNLRISISAGFKQQKTTAVFERETWVPSTTGAMVRGTPSRTTVETTMGRGVLNLAFSWK